MGDNKPSEAVSNSNGSPSYTSAARVIRFRQELRSNTINLVDVSKLAYEGVPDKYGLRPLVWKLLLAYLPIDTAAWPALLGKKRKAYAEFCEELVLDPKKFPDPHNDHPLNQHEDSSWHAYFRDAEMMEQIDRDVMRTHPDMHFFSGDGEPSKRHREDMKRALFVYAKLNPGIKYVQGMNEIYAPIYHQFATDTDSVAAQHAEADAFFCFVELISEFRDHFCQHLDNSAVGIRATIAKLNRMLQGYDPELWAHLEQRNKVNPQFYAFRWITLLLTQEFPFPDLVRLWDSLFSDPGGHMDCLLRFCIAMLLNIREELLQGDFSQNIKLLQNYPPVDVHAIIHQAMQLKLAS